MKPLDGTPKVLTDIPKYKARQIRDLYKRGISLSEITRCTGIPFHLVQRVIERA